VILPTVAEVGGRVRVSAEVIDPQSQTTVYAEYADGSGLGSVLASVDAVTAALRGRLGEEIKAIERDSEPLPQVSTANLDALRAYALGQKAFQANSYADAQALFNQAAEIDPEFALAYVALLRTHNAMGDRLQGVPYLRKAQALRERLPLKDMLYLDAWSAEVDDPGAALQKWRHLAQLYPDYYPALSNAGWALFYRNRFGEALPYAQRATASQYELATLNLELLGRIHLARGELAAAAATLDRAIEAGATLSALPRANVEAVRFQHDQAQRIWQANAPYPVAATNHLTLLMDRGRWKEARAEAKALLDASGDKAQARFARVPDALFAWLEGEDREAIRGLRRAADEALSALDDPGQSADKMTDAYLALVSGLMAQRIGEPALAREVLERLQSHGGLLETAYVADLALVLRSRDLMSHGKIDDAVDLLESGITGHERYELHSALLDAYIALGEHENALREARWLSERRGWAYTQLGCGLCQQALNVMDSNRARLRAADILRKLGREQDAAKQVSMLEPYWNGSNLPSYLRERGELVVTASK
jgi:putative peptide modification system cyclase